MSTVTGAGVVDRTTWSLRTHVLGPSEGPRADARGPEAPALHLGAHAVSVAGPHPRGAHVRDHVSLASHHVSSRHGVRPAGRTPEASMSLKATRSLCPHRPRLPVPTLGSSPSCCTGAGSKGSVPGPSAADLVHVRTPLHVAWVVPDLTLVLRSVERGHARLTTSKSVVRLRQGA